MTSGGSAVSLPARGGESPSSARDQQTHRKLGMFRIFAAILLEGGIFKITGFVILCALLLTERGIAQNAFSPPTATEIFHLHSECAALGQKILDENVIGRALEQSQTSRYNPVTNRCYVELVVQSADLTKPMKIFSQYLFDGQTGEMLASLKVENGQKSGTVFDRNHQTTTYANAGWDDAQDYINAMMADDRKQ
jgi:hypothetical protein